MLCYVIGSSFFTFTELPRMKKGELTTTQNAAPQEFVFVCAYARHESQSSYLASSMMKIVPSTAMLPIDRSFPHRYDVSTPSSSDQCISEAL